MSQTTSYNQVAESESTSRNDPPTTSAPSRYSTRRGRYATPSAPRPRQLSNALPPLNIQGPMSASMTRRLEEDYRAGRMSERVDVEREVLQAIMETGTDEKGRRELKARYAGLGEAERRRREVLLAQYSGFVMNSDGTLDYGLDCESGKRKKWWKALFR